METERPTSAEAEGTTLGEAKWHAVKALEPDFPGVGADCVSFEVLDEGNDAGGHPARVRVQLDLEAWERMAHEIPEEPAVCIFLQHRGYGLRRHERGVRHQW